MSSSQQVNVKEERHDEAEIRELADKILEQNKAKLAAAAGNYNKWLPKIITSTITTGTKYNVNFTKKLLKF